MLYELHRFHFFAFCLLIVSSLLMLSNRLSLFFFFFFWMRVSVNRLYALAFVFLAPCGRR